MPSPKTCRRPGLRRVEIPSDLAMGMQILEAIVLELQLAGFETRQIGRIELAFTESLINAIRHGNQDDPQKLVLIEYEIGINDFRLSIEDEGQGFNPQDVDDPTSPDNILRPGGRGLLLIQSLGHQVEFNTPGNRIAIRFLKETRRAA